LTCTIFVLHGQRVLLGAELAALHGVDGVDGVATSVLLQA